MPGTARGKAAGGWVVPCVIVIALIVAACFTPDATIAGDVRIAPTSAAAPVPFPASTSQRASHAATSRAPGERIRFDHYNVEQGLSQSSPRCIVEDHRGFIWVGTEDGLNRFDGYTFTVYRNDPGNPNSLSNNHVRAIDVDSTGVLWIGTYGGGLDRFDPVTGHFTHYAHDRNNPDEVHTLSDNQVLAVHVDQVGAVWIGTRGGTLDRLDPVSGRFTHYRSNPDDPDSLTSGGVRSILEDSAGRLWIGTGAGLVRLDRETGRFRRFRHDPDDANSLSDEVVNRLAEDAAGNLWVATNGGLNRLEPETERFTHYRHVVHDPYTLSGDQVLSVVADGTAGVVWVGTASGLNRFDPLTGRFTAYRHDLVDPYSLSNDNVESLYIDRSGGLWVGTYGGGLNRYDSLSQRFVLYQHEPSNPNSLSHNSIWSVRETADGILWIGTNGGGLNRLDRETGEWRHYRHDSDDPNSLSSDDVTSIYEDDLGQLWLGTIGGGLERFDPRTGKFAHYSYDATDTASLSSDVAWVIHPRRDGGLWIGTGNGLSRFDPRTEEFVRYRNDPADPYSLSDNNVGSIYEDASGVVWLGTHQGLNAFDQDTGQFTHYYHDPHDAQTIAHDIVFAIHEDQSGDLWLGTWGGGLDKLDRQAGAFRHYRTQDGLPNNVVYGILEDARGNLWLSTNNGLSSFDPRTETFKNFDTADGLQSPEFNYNAYFKSTSGEMFFGGINGLNAFYPADIVDNPFVPPVVLTTVTQRGAPIPLDEAVAAASGLTFAWPNNHFGFGFAALSYFQPEQNQYAYRLDGFDPGWNYVEHRRYGQYTNLPGGVYTLRVKGSNNDGVWNETGFALRVTIVPPLWERMWFRAGFVLLVLGIGVGGYRLRVGRMAVRTRELERLVGERTEALAQRTSESVRRQREMEALYRENARLYADTESRLTQLTALQETTRAVASTLDLDKLLNLIIEQAATLLHAEGGILNLVDWEKHEDEVVACTGAARGLTGIRSGLDSGLSGWVALHNQPVICNDVPSDSRVDRQALGWISSATVHHAAMAPLTIRNQVVGTLAVLATGERAKGFDEADLELLVAFANQAATAIENARLYEAEQLRADQFRAISEVGQRITSILDIDEVLVQIVRLIRDAFDYYHVGLGLVEGDVVAYKVGAGQLWDDPDFDFVPSRLKVGEEGITGHVAATGAPLLVRDVEQDPRYVSMAGSATRSELAVPIKVKGKVIGVLDVQSDRVDAFEEPDLSVLQSLAHQAAIAIENAQLYEQAQEAAIVEERGRLARELHDAVTQTLFSASLLAEVLPATWDTDRAEGEQLLDELQQLSRGALAEMRALLLELRPAVLVEADLRDLLHQLAAAVTGRTGVPVRVTAHSADCLPDEVHIALYRIAQEALNNVVKHSNATDVTVDFACGGGDTPIEVRLCVDDDGVGFDPASVAPERLGLGIIRERAQAIGATLQIDSAVGCGTRVVVTWHGQRDGRVAKEKI